ncbi:hypothetical protein IKF94_02060 [Candidatus Saccharibacteria bacterium]|nr:hypothetical protein [Candidatus Saccharibacteria bacterium]
MAKTTSSRKSMRRAKKPKEGVPRVSVQPAFKESFLRAKSATKNRILAKKLAKYHGHRSFKRSYREDYDRPFEAPGLLAHAVESFKMLFKNWRLFLPFVLILVISNILLVGLMSEDTYVTFQKSLNETADKIKAGELGTFARSGLLLISTITTGGLSQGMTESQQLAMVILFLITWLVTIYLVRQRLAGYKVKLRDGLYNALSPFISTLIVLAVIFIEAIPLMIVVITYSAAVSTDFLATPFYALIYFIFAVLLTLLSVYLISSSLIALIAVSAPGLYPLVAVSTARDLLVGRRIKFIIRVIYLFIVLVIVWVIVMLPLIALDLVLKQAFDWLRGVPVVSFELLFMTCFSMVYTTIYLYLFYRRLLDYDN